MFTAPSSLLPVPYSLLPAPCSLLPQFGPPDALACAAALPWWAAVRRDRNNAGGRIRGEGRRGGLARRRPQRAMDVALSRWPFPRRAARGIRHAAVGRDGGGGDREGDGLSGKSGLGRGRAAGNAGTRAVGWMVALQQVRTAETCCVLTNSGPT